MNTQASYLLRIVKDEAMLWGEDVAEAYHKRASEHMDAQWNDLLAPFFARHQFDLTRVIDFAAGFGRNTHKLLEAGAKEVIAVDVNADCINRLTSEFPGKSVRAVLVDGYDLAPLPERAATFLYTFDAMVHFDLEIVIAYLREFYRVLSPNSGALIHHSNYDGSPGSDFRQNPHWRNFMTAGVFRHIAMRSGFDVLQQAVFSWGEAKDSDCITVLRRKS